MSTSDIDAIWFACRSKACAPPPVGKGGSLDVAGSEMPAATAKKLTAAKKSKASSGRKKTSKAVSAKLQSRIDTLKERQEAIQDVLKSKRVSMKQADRYYKASDDVQWNIPSAGGRSRRANKAKDRYDAAERPEKRAKLDDAWWKVTDAHRAKVAKAAK